MEFIEGEKNFNKILSRLSAIMHQDDPRYLDLTFDRTVEQRKKYKQDMEAATAAATTLSSAAAKEEESDVVEALDPKILTLEVESSISHKKNSDAKLVDQDHDMEQADQQEAEKKENDQGDHMEEDDDIDIEAQEVVKKVKELLLVKYKIRVFLFVINISTKLLLQIGKYQL
jgi:hypothetical protein